MNFLNIPGRPLGDAAIEAIFLVGKTGFICRQTWNKFFAKGCKRWWREQLSLLVKSNYLMVHQNAAGKDIFVLGMKGQQLLEQNGRGFVLPPMIDTISHDRVIMQSLLRLSQLGFVSKWQSEAELKKDNISGLGLRVKNNAIKFPDATAIISMAGSDRQVAFEFERVRKSFSRYGEILFAYAQLQSFSLILYICETDGIKAAIKKTLNEMKRPNLENRIGFVDGAAWKENPESAPITLRNGVVKLVDLCKNNSQKLAA